MEIIEPTINDPDEISLFYICKIILIIIYAMLKDKVPRSTYFSCNQKNTYGFEPYFYISCSFYCLTHLLTLLSCRKIHIFPKTKF